MCEVAPLGRGQGGKHVNVSDFVEVLSFVLLVTALMIPTGNYLYRLMEAGEGPLGRVFLPLERPLYRLMGVDPDAEMDFRAYAKALVFSNLFMMLLGYVVFRLQAYLPPQSRRDPEPIAGFGL